MCSAPFLCGPQTGLPAVAPHPLLRGPVAYAGGARWGDVHGALAPGYVTEWPYSTWDRNGTLAFGIPPGLLAQCRLRTLAAAAAGASASDVAAYMWDPFAMRVLPEVLDCGAAARKYRSFATEASAGSVVAYGDGNATVYYDVEWYAGLAPAAAKCVSRNYGTGAPGTAADAVRVLGGIAAQAVAAAQGKATAAHLATQTCVAEAQKASDRCLCQAAAASSMTLRSAWSEWQVQV